MEVEYNALPRQVLEKIKSRTLTLEEMKDLMDLLNYYYVSYKKWALATRVSIVLFLLSAVGLFFTFVSVSNQHNDIGLLIFSFLILIGSFIFVVISASHVNKLIFVKQGLTALKKHYPFEFQQIINN